MSRFHPQRYRPYQLTIMRLQMKSVQKGVWNYIIHAAERAFVEGEFIHSVSLGTLASVRFAIPTEDAKQMKIKLLK